MSDRGFTLVELLMALVVGLMVGGGALLLAGAAQSAITVEPVTTDTVRRLQAGVETIASAIGGAGGERGIGPDSGSIWNGMPALRLVTSGGDTFTGLIATRVVHGGRGRLVEDQPGPGGPLTLALTDGMCPATQVVCGFRDGDVALVFDERGHFDVFIVGSVSPPRMAPRAPLALAVATFRPATASHGRLATGRCSISSPSAMRMMCSDRWPTLTAMTKSSSPINSHRSGMSRRVQSVSPLNGSTHFKRS